MWLSVFFVVRMLSYLSSCDEVGIRSAKGLEVDL